MMTDPSPFSQPAPDPESQASASAVSDAVAEMQREQQISAQADVDAMRLLARRQAERTADAEEQRLREIIGASLNAYPMRRTRWLWVPGDNDRGAIPMGELTLIGGKGGVGKSTVLSTMAAWITKGTMFGEFHGTPRAVIYIPNEDDIAETVKPRIIAADGDADLVFIPKLREATGDWGKLSMPRDIERLGEFAASKNAVAIMFDPLSSNLDVQNRNNADDIRRVLEAMRRMAETYGLALIGLAHTRKASSASMMDALMGSSEIGNVCRSILGVMVDPDEDDAIILSHDKSNRDKTADSYAYRVVDQLLYEGTELIKTSRIEFLGKRDKKVSDMMADAMTGGQMETKSAVQEAEDFLRAYLTDKGGQALKKDIMNAAASEKVSMRAVQRAMGRMKIVSRSSGQGASRLWCLPGS